MQLEPDIETLVRSPGVGVRTAPYVTLYNGSQSVIAAHYVGRFTQYLFLGTQGAVLHHSAETVLCFRIHILFLFVCSSSQSISNTLLM